MNSVPKHLFVPINPVKCHDATSLFKANHKLMQELFYQYEKAKTAISKKELISQICTELKLYAQIEEEIFYPAIKQAIKNKKLIPEAAVEHTTLQWMISQIEDTEPDDEMFDAKVKVLSEYVEHLVKKEQNEIFPRARSTKIDMLELGSKVMKRKEELLAARNNA